MHDIKAIRDNPAAFDTGLARRGLEPMAAELLKIDAERRDHVQKLQDAQARRNAASKEIGDAMKSGDKARAEALKAEHLFKARQMAEAWDEASPRCEVLA